MLTYPAGRGALACGLGVGESVTAIAVGYEERRGPRGTPRCTGWWVGGWPAVWLAGVEQTAQDAGRGPGGGSESDRREAARVCGGGVGAMSEKSIYGGQLRPLELSANVGSGEWRGEGEARGRATGKPRLESLRGEKVDQAVEPLGAVCRVAVAASTRAARRRGCGAGCVRARCGIAGLWQGSMEWGPRV